MLFLSESLLRWCSGFLMLMGLYVGGFACLLISPAAESCVLSMWSSEITKKLVSTIISVRGTHDSTLQMLDNDLTSTL